MKDLVRAPVERILNAVVDPAAITASDRVVDAGSECARVLKSGGRIVAQDWMAADGMSDGEYREHIQPRSPRRAPCST